MSSWVKAKRSCESGYKGMIKKVYLSSKPVKSKVDEGI